MLYIILSVLLEFVACPGTTVTGSDTKSYTALKFAYTALKFAYDRNSLVTYYSPNMARLKEKILFDFG